MAQPLPKAAKVLTFPDAPQSPPNRDAWSRRNITLAMAGSPHRRVEDQPPAPRQERIGQVIIIHPDQGCPDQAGRYTDRHPR